jgi:membrane-associated phospholipid phosphatase
MARRASPLFATASVICALTISASHVDAQVLAPQPVGQGQTGTPASEPVSSLLDQTQSDSPSSTFVPSLGQVFSKTFKEDFRRLPSLDSAVILGLGGLASSLGHSSDQRISAGMVGSNSSFYKPGVWIGAATVQMGAAFAVYSLGRSTGHPKLAAVGADLVSAQIVSQTLTQAIKFSVGRTRPDGTAYSFPSGHSATSFATAAVLQRHFGWKAGIPAYALATYVAASRIETQRHFLSDVAFGAAIGMVSGRTVTLGHGNARFALSPAAAPGGGGVNFTWVGKK